MNSMTGFGRGIAADESLQIMVEIKSVNSRFLDLHINLPSTLNFFENELRRQIKAVLQRGKVEVNISLRNTRDREKVFTVNDSLALQIREFLVSNGFAQDIKKVPLRDMMTVSSDWLLLEDVPFEEANLQATATKALQDALAGVAAMRAAEGEHLRREIEGRIDILTDVLSEVDANKTAAVKNTKHDCSSESKIPWQKLIWISTWIDFCRK